MFSPKNKVTKIRCLGSDINDFDPLLTRKKASFRLSCRDCDGFNENQNIGVF